MSESKAKFDLVPSRSKQIEHLKKIRDKKAERAKLRRVDAILKDKDLVSLLDELRGGIGTERLEPIKKEKRLRAFKPVFKDPHVDNEYKLFKKHMETQLPQLVVKKKTKGKQVEKEEEEEEEPVQEEETPSEAPSDDVSEVESEAPTEASTDLSTEASTESSTETSTESSTKSTKKLKKMMKQILLNQQLEELRREQQAQEPEPEPEPIVRNGRGQHSKNYSFEEPAPAPVRAPVVHHAYESMKVRGNNNDNLRNLLKQASQYRNAPTDIFR